MNTDIWDEQYENFEQNKISGFRDICNVPDFLDTLYNQCVLTYGPPTWIK